jgi:hypothetical protein
MGYKEKEEDAAKVLGMLMTDAIIETSNAAVIINIDFITVAFLCVLLL